MNLIIRFIMSIIMMFVTVMPASCMEQKEVYKCIALEDIDNGSDTITNDTVLPLGCMDHREVQVPLKCLRYAHTLEHVFQDAGILVAINGSIITIKPILLSSVDSEVVMFIFNTLVPRLANKNLTKEILYEFCSNKHIDFILDVIKAVNYLDIKDNLLAMLIKYAAHRIKKDPKKNSIHPRIAHSSKDIPLPLLRMLCNDFTPLTMDVDILHKDNLNMSDVRCIYPLVTKAGLRIVSGSQAGELSISDGAGNSIIKWQAHEGPINAVYLLEAEEGLLIVSGSDDMTLCVWDIKGTRLTQCEGHTEEVTAVGAVTLGKETVFISGSDDRTVCLWNIDGSLRTTYKGHEQGITAVYATTTTKGCFIISGSQDGTVCVCDSNGQLIVTFKGHSNLVNSVSVLETGDCILFASAARDKTVRLWDMQGKQLVLFDLHNKVIEYIAFTKIAEAIRLVCASDDGALYIYNTTGELHSSSIPKKQQWSYAKTSFFVADNGLSVIYGHCNGFMSIGKAVLPFNRKQAQELYELVTSTKKDAKPISSTGVKSAIICFGLVCIVCSCMKYFFVN